MPWLAINGLNVGSLALVGEKPKGERRDIGDMSPAGDGSMSVTRQTRKRDLKFTTRPLTGGDAHAWESLLIGEGERWNFDANEYGSKGTGPVAGSFSIVASAGKFGAGFLRLPATTGSMTFAAVVTNLFGGTADWTVMIWRFETGAWHHYIVRSDTAKWVDGARNDAASTTWLTVVGGNVILANASGSAVDYDDLVCLPFKIVDSWAPVFGTSTSSFSALPYLNATGNLVNEQPTRRVLGMVSETVLVASSGGSRQADMKQLEVELKAA